MCVGENMIEFVNGELIICLLLLQTSVDGIITISIRSHRVNSLAHL